MAARISVTAALAFALVLLSPVSLSSALLSSMTAAQIVHAVAQGENTQNKNAQDEGPLVAPPSAADLAAGQVSAASSPDFPAIVVEMQGDPAQQSPAPMRSTIEQFLRIGAPVDGPFDFASYQAMQQELPEFWPYATPRSEDVCAPHQSVANSENGSGMPQFFSANEYTSSRRTQTFEPKDGSVAAKLGVRATDEITPLGAFNSLFTTSQWPAANSEWAAEIDQYLQIEPTQAGPIMREFEFPDIASQKFVDSRTPFQQRVPAKPPTFEERVSEIKTSRQIPHESPVVHQPTDAQVLDLEDGEAAAELLPIFMKQQSALEGTVFFDGGAEGDTELGAQRNFVERIRALEAARGQFPQADVENSSFGQPVPQQAASTFTPDNIDWSNLPAGFQVDLSSLPTSGASVTNPAAYQSPGPADQSFGSQPGYGQYQDPPPNAEPIGDPYAAVVPQYAPQQAYTPVVSEQTMHPDTKEFAVDVLRNSAEQMEHSANLMERKNLFDEADKLRKMANELRLQARAYIQGVATPHISPQVGPSVSPTMPQGVMPSPPAVAPYTDEPVLSPSGSSHDGPVYHPQQYFRPVSENWDEGFRPSQAPPEHNPFELLLLDSERSGRWWLWDDRDGGAFDFFIGYFR